MKWKRSWVILAVLLTTVSSIQVREPENETEQPTAAPTESAAVESPDNSMAVGEAPTEVRSASLGTPLFQVADNAEFSTSKPAVDATFPDNHNPNFTASPYAGTIETPPLLNNFNKYQNAYKEYYAQKNEFISAKPIKFEDNYSKNKFITAANGLSAYGDETQAGSNVHTRNKPLPYLYNGHQDLQAADDGRFDSGVGNANSAFNLFPSTMSPLSGLFAHSHKPKTDVVEGGKDGAWKKTLRFLSTVIPFGIFLATLTPNILQINTVEDNRPSRLRSLDEAPTEDPLVELVARFGGLDAMDDPVCEDRFFCEMSVLGKRETSNFVERGFWFLANETPDDMAQEAGMKDLFKAIRTDSCHLYDCKPPPKKQPQPKLDHHLESITDEKKHKSKKSKKFYRS